MIYLLLAKAEQLGLFDSVVHVAPHVRKDGTYVAEHQRHQKVRQADLFGAPEKPQEPSAKAKARRLIDFVKRKGGAERMGALLSGQPAEVVGRMVDGFVKETGLSAGQVRAVLGLGGERKPAEMPESRADAGEQVVTAATDQEPIKNEKPADAGPAAESAPADQEPVKKLEPAVFESRRDALASLDAADKVALKKDGKWVAAAGAEVDRLKADGWADPAAPVEPKSATVGEALQALSGDKVGKIDFDGLAYLSNTVGLKGLDDATLLRVRNAISLISHMRDTGRLSGTHALKIRDKLRGQAVLDMVEQVSARIAEGGDPLDAVRKYFGYEAENQPQEPVTVQAATPGEEHAIPPEPEGPRGVIRIENNEHKKRRVALKNPAEYSSLGKLLQAAEYILANGVERAAGQSRGMWLHNAEYIATSKFGDATAIPKLRRKYAITRRQDLKGLVGGDAVFGIELPKRGYGVGDNVPGVGEIEDEVDSPYGRQFKINGQWFAERSIDPNADSYPKEGDTKNIAGIEYRLQDGRWHRVTPEERAAAAEQRTLEPAADQPAVGNAPSPLEALFSDLTSGSTRKANKARKAAAKLPQAARIEYVEANFHDLLIQMMEAGALEVNGATTLTEDNAPCL